MAIISSKKFSPSEDEQSRPQYIQDKRTAFLHAFYGLWFPDPKMEFDVYSLTSDVIIKLKPEDQLWVFVKMFKSLHLYHRHGLFFKDFKAEDVLVYLEPSNRNNGGVRIVQNPVAFSRKNEPKQDIYIAGAILSPLTKRNDKYQ